METLMSYFDKYVAAGAGKLAGFQFEYLTTPGFAALVTFFGRFPASKSKVLQKYTVSTPIISGLIFSPVISGIKDTGITEFTFDAKIIKDLYQNLFFFCAGYGFSAKMPKNAGGKLCTMTVFVACLLITLQSILDVALAHAIGMNSLLVLQCSSVSMSGGVGTASVFGPILEKMGAADATTVGVAVGTLGNIMGSLIGGLVAAYLITSKGLKSDSNDKPEAQRTGERPTLDNTRMIHAFAAYLLPAAFGMPIYMLLGSIPMIEMSKFTGCLSAGTIGRNVMETLGVDMRVSETEAIEHVLLELYLALVLMTIGITKLAPVADQMDITPVAQVIMMTIFAIFIPFNLFGKDYGAAVMAVGNCGWGCGSGPNTVANKKVVMDQHGYHDVARVLYSPFTVIIDDIYDPICFPLTGSFFGK